MNFLRKWNNEALHQNQIKKGEDEIIKRLHLLS